METRLGPENIRIKGAIFCQVRRIALWNQLISSITWGNQKWVGAIPDFTPRDKVIRLLSCLREFVEISFVVNRATKTIIKEAKACVRKYLMEASDVDGEGE